MLPTMETVLEYSTVFGLDKRARTAYFSVNCAFTFEGHHLKKLGHSFVFGFPTGSRYSEVHSYS